MSWALKLNGASAQDEEQNFNHPHKAHIQVQIQNVGGKVMNRHIFRCRHFLGLSGNFLII
jgi:hypothetical protein